MTPTQSAVAAAPAPAGSVLRSSSPIAYLFGGLALMLILIALALIILVCSYKKPFSVVNSSNGDGGESLEKSSSSKYRRNFPVPEMEPKVVIVMPGDINPTYLATPVAKSTVAMATPQQREEV